MATAEFNRMMLWTDLEDTVLGDRWRIVRLVRPEGRVAWFEAVSIDGKPLMLSITETLNDDDELLHRLRAAAEIRHPNLVRIIDAVPDQIDDSPVVIAAMERTEENLEDVLRDRVLNSSEAQVVLDALVQGIAAIHARGLIHGRMEPSSILALGDIIKLRSDCLHIPQMGFAVAAAANVQGIGRIVTQAMTRRDPLSENDPVLQLLPDPLARAVRRALTGHARVDEIAALAGIRILPAKDPEPEIQEPAPPRFVSAALPETAEVLPAPAKAEMELNASPDLPKPLEERSAAKETEKPSTDERGAPLLSVPPAAGKESVATPSALRQPAHFPETEPARDLSHLLADDEENPPLWRRPSAPLVLGGATGILLITIFTLFILLHRSPSPANSAAPRIVTQQTQPTAMKASPVIHPSAVASPRSTAAPQPGWRVIAWTYDRESEAQLKADTLAKKYPQLHPAVFALRGHAPYLVTLGGVMTKDQAFALRKEAVRLGLPRDTYAQNYH